MTEEPFASPPPLASDPMAINVVAQIVREQFGDADGFMLLSRREGVAIQILNALAGVLAQRGFFWLGDLAGFTVGMDWQIGGPLELSHRCGWTEEIRDADAFLANIAVRAIEVRQKHRCEWPHAAIPREEKTT